MKYIECYDCKGQIPDVVGCVDIDSKPICPECEKKRYLEWKNKL